MLKKIFDDSKIKYDEKAVQLIARAGEGSVRDALSVADMNKIVENYKKEVEIIEEEEPQEDIPVVEIEDKKIPDLEIKLPKTGM